MNHAGNGIVARSLRLLLADPVLDQIVSRSDRIGVARDRDNAVSGTGGEDALLRDLYVRAAQVLYLNEIPTAGSQYCSHYNLCNLNVFLALLDAGGGGCGGGARRVHLAGAGALTYEWQLVRAEAERVVVEVYRRGCRGGGAAVLPEGIDEGLVAVERGAWRGRGGAEGGHRADGPEDAAVVAWPVGYRRLRVHRVAEVRHGRGHADAHAEDVVLDEGGHGCEDLRGGRLGVAGAAQAQLDVLEQLVRRAGRRARRQSRAEVQVQAEAGAVQQAHCLKILTNYSVHLIFII